jgi:hypothetical protein
VVVQSRLTPPDWTAGGDKEEQARCLKFEIKRNPETGFVDAENDAWFKLAEEALPVCNGDYEGTPCPLRASCLRAALVNNENHGVWGGLTAPQRKWIRRNIPKDYWNDEAHIRRRTPPPEHFKDLGNEEDDF